MPELANTLFCDLPDDVVCQRADVDAGSEGFPQESADAVVVDLFRCPGLELDL